MLFPTTNPLGKEIRVGPEAFTVIGVLGQARPDVRPEPRQLRRPAHHHA
ncbi:MAG: ABC transporter permease [Candidatus Moduliflexus flocculans]|nr:ABC transporter permease [Candidatus Moduliflexus flocculans]